MVFALMMTSALQTITGLIQSIFKWFQNDAIGWQASDHMTRQDSTMPEKQHESEHHENDCNRSGLDRRQFSYSYHIPERRSGKDRRQGFDRSRGFSSRSGMERRDH